MNNFFNLSAQEVLEKIGASKTGLTAQEVAASKEKHGENVLLQAKKKGVLLVFLEQFKDLLVIILIAAAIISMVSGNVESTIVIFAVIILNAILGTVQHFKAQKSLDSLKALSSPNAKVIRDGVKLELPSKEVVVGDIVMLEAGDLVVADGRLIENFSLQVNESMLTGESENVNKDIQAIIKTEIALGDQINMVFSGSLVTYGRGMFVVTSVGMGTQIGKIATLMNQTQQKKTPLQINLDNFSKKLAVVIIGICALVFFLGIARKMPMLDSLMFAVALAVAAIPEALSSIVTIVLAMGTQKMVRENAIIKELKAVESLGCVSVICSDKTGTLTQNKMTVEQLYIDNIILDDRQLNISNPVHKYLLNIAVLTNDSTVVDGKKIGDPTEFAMVDFAHTYNINELDVRAGLPRCSEIPFDSDRKLMSTVHVIDGEHMLLTKGALDVMLGRTTKIMMTNGVRDITDADFANIENANLKMSQNGLRVLSFGYRPMGSNACATLNDENDYIFVGLIAMIDPPREESKQAVASAIEAGIKTVMITGDHKITATAIAKQIGIFTQGDIAVTGVELEKMSDAELMEKLESISVYARVSPEHKIRIVDAWQSKGKIVSMTGDGVNDAPALKKADIGIAMGITGTEVSKDAASMILTDDNFATIVKAVENGRKVYANIKNSIKFLLSGNTAGILGVLYTSLLGLPVPFAPVHLLFINLLTDSLPAIAIGVEPSSGNVLKDKPRSPNESILSKDFLIRILVEGSIIGLFTILAYYAGNPLATPALASTMAFATLTLARLFHGFNCRGKSSIFKLKLLSNKPSVLAFLGGVLLLCVVLFVPFMQSLFSVTPLAGQQVAIIAGLSFAPTFIIQTYKLIRENSKLAKK